MTEWEAIRDDERRVVFLTGVRGEDGREWSKDEAAWVDKATAAVLFEQGLVRKPQSRDE